MGFPWSSDVAEFLLVVVNDFGDHVNNDEGVWPWNDLNKHSGSVT